MRIAIVGGTGSFGRALAERISTLGENVVIGSRDATDTALLAECILATVDDPDFFLRKGIGWALREHAKTDPGWVRRFTTSYRSRLSPLSLREATRTLAPS